MSLRNVKRQIKAQLPDNIQLSLCNLILQQFVKQKERTIIHYIAKFVELREDRVRGMYNGPRSFRSVNNFAREVDTAEGDLLNTCKVTKVYEPSNCTLETS